MEHRTLPIYLADSARHTLAKLQEEAAGHADPASFAQALADAELEVALAEADKDFIVVKAELNAGETQAIFAEIVTDARQGEAWKLDPKQVGITRMLQWLTDWSFTMTLPDGAEVKAPITEGAVKGLETDTFREINQALDWHEENVEATKAARKNARGSEIGSSKTSPSPSAVAGASSGSES